jgi:dimethylhistidine N-methyltransferase
MTAAAIPYGFISPMRSDLLTGFRGRPKSIPCKYFYDEQGSRLFEQICELDEYYPTRTELGILHAHAPAIARALGPRVRVVELGSGSGNKTDLFVDALDRPAQYVAVDISAEALIAATHRLSRRRRDLAVGRVVADYTQSFTLPASPEPHEKTVAYFPGSTLGNFEPEEASAFLGRLARMVGPSGAVVLGVDLKKNPAVLHAAYNDGLGVTARFNLNVLAHANREVGTNFDLGRFYHSAFYDPAFGRIEMFLVSAGRQTVRIGDDEFRLEDGEGILTEYSYKFTRHGLDTLAASAGLRVAEVWTDERRWFALALLVR